MSSSERGPVAILSGAGQLPVELAEALERAGREHRILAFRGFADRAVRRRADAVVDLLDLKGIRTCLDGWRPSAVTLVGGVRRPSPAALLGAYSLFRNAGEVREVISRGDDRVLRGAVSLLEEWGHTVVGAHELAPGLLAAGGRLGRVAPDKGSEDSIATGLTLLEALAPFDVGQAAVIVGQRVLAVEGPEGTDRMLRRVRRLQAWAWIARAPRGGVLVKAAKRAQDLRVDMPAVGPRTVGEAARAGLLGIAVGEGTTLLLDRDETIRAADRLGLFLVGIRRDGARSGSA